LEFIKFSEALSFSSKSKVTHGTHQAVGRKWIWWNWY